MKVVPKLGLALFAGVFAVVGGFTAWYVHTEIEAFDRDARRDQRIVGLTAGAALARSRTLEDALLLADRVDATREFIRVRYVSMRPDAPEHLRPALGVELAKLPAAGAALQLVRPAGDGENADLLVTYVPAPVMGEPAGAMELSQPLASRAEYIWRGIWSALASALAMLVVGGVAMALIGARVVGQPVRELIAAARRIGAGHFDVLTATHRQDEFGELGRALRAMSVELGAAQRRAQAEAEAKIQALEQLRHAERLTTLGKLASVLAHEIGTPLNVIAGHAKLLNSGKLDAAATRESLSAIGTQCGRITTIVRRVLDYARRRPAKRTEVQGVDLLQHARTMLQSFAEEKGVELTLDAERADTAILADPDQLQQALTNVMLNAIYATPPGGKVELGVHSDGPAVSFTIRDHGSGLSPDVRERMFEPFFTTKPPGEGTGLGLSVTRDIVVEHGGSIDVSSLPEQGTSFVIKLPMRTNGSAHPGS